MATIFEEIHGLSPKIELIKRQHIVEKYAYNVGSKEPKSSKYFSMLWEAFAWAAILGFYYNKRKPLQGKLTSDSFKYSQIRNNGEDIFYSLILFTIAKEGYEILTNVNKVNNVIEEYANGGFEIIYTILEEKGNDYFGNDANFLQEVLDRDKDNSDKDTNEYSENQVYKKQKGKIKIDDGEGGNFDF